MNAATAFDLGPLTWVKGEIDQALQRGEVALAAYETGGDRTELRFCRTHVHQVQGALAMVGLDAPAQVCEAMEALLQGMESGELPDGDASVSALRQGIVALRGFLDELMAGGANQGLRLLPCYQALAGVRGEAAMHPADLFFPDLAQTPPKRQAAPAELPPEQQLQRLKAERLGFQKGLLGWLKKPDAAEAGRCLMRDAIAAIEALQVTPAARAFWWVAQAYLEALADAGLASDPLARQLCSRIDAQIRRLLDGLPPQADRVLREALYYIAQVPAGTSPLVAEVQQAYDLAALLPEAPVPDTVPAAGEAVWRGLRDLLTPLEEAWAQCCGVPVTGLAAFADLARRCSQQAEAIGHTDLKRLGQALSALAQWLSEDEHRFNDSVAMEVATAILLLQAAQEHHARLGTDFAQQVDVMVARLYACLSGMPAHDIDLPALDEMTRRAQEKLLVGQVGREIRSNLAQIEQVLDGYFRDPEHKPDLAALDTPLKQVGGALAMLGHFSAVRYLQEGGARIRAMAQPDYVLAVGDFEALARQLSLLGFFVEALAGGENDFEAFAARMLGAPLPEPGLSVVPAEAGASTTAVPDAGNAPPLAEAAQPAAGLPGAAMDATDDSAAVDRELLGIFLEEAADVLLSLRQHRAQLVAGAASHEALTEIRRGTHTLKGSGRMVGLNALGEVAWELEQTYNLWLRQEQTVTPSLLDLVDAQVALFDDWLARLNEGSASAPSTANIVLLARQLRGETVAAAIAAAEPPAAVPLPEGEAVAAPVPAEAFAFSDLDLPALTVPPVDGLDHEEIRLQVAAEALEDLLVPEEAGEPAPAPEAVPMPPVSPSPPAALTLYDIFREEAGGHLATLVTAYQQLEAEPEAPTAFEMMRAAHTLGGIAGTVGILPIHHLAIALEHALKRRDAAQQPGSLEGLETVRQAIITLEEMFAALKRQETLQAQAPLCVALEEIYPPAPASTEGEAAGGGARIIPLPGVPELRPAEPGATPIVVERPTAAMNDELDEQLLAELLDASTDLLQALDERLRAWRQEPDNPHLPAAIARLLHTFKGNARMAGAMALGESLHQLEGRVGELGQSLPVPLTGIDEVESGVDALAQRLGLLSASPAQATATGAASEPGAAATGPAGETLGAASTGQLRVNAELVDRLVNEAGELAIARSRIEGEMRQLKGSLLDLTENVIRLRRQLRDIEIQAESQMQARALPSSASQPGFDPLELDRFTRFQELTRFMAESVNDVATVQQGLLRNLDAANVAIHAQARLNRSLQQDLLSVRMLPFGSQSERLHRIVRQTAKALGKRANLEIFGAEVEIDRSILDKMQAPLEHMLRNAIAHGLEDSAAREALGKPPVGEITIRLTQEGNEIVLTLADDGRGLDAGKIRSRAEAQGLLAAGETLSDADLFELIFRPGFSTADGVDQIAGRGIGMDVVRSEVSALGGRVEIASHAGQGTRFQLHLPLTLVLTQTLLARAGDQVYALPSAMIGQVLEMKPAALEAARASGEIVWQDQAYPLHYLPHLLGYAEAVAENQRRCRVLLLRSAAQRLAVQVDELKGNQEVVVKHVGPQVARVPGVAGATVLGDGRVVLILNPLALPAPRPVISADAHADSSAITAIAARPSPVAAPQAPIVMVVDDSLTVRKITSRLLGREGYEVVLAKDGVDALEQLIDLRPAVILSDVEMPRMDGFDLLRNLRGDPRWRDIPVIMITSRTADKHRDHALAIGASHYLGKPYDEAELLGLIAGYCNRG